MCSEIFSDMSHVLFYILYAVDILETVSYIDLGKDKILLQCFSDHHLGHQLKLLPRLPEVSG